MTQQIQNELLPFPINEVAGTAIASAATVNLTTATGNFVHITGTAAITAITLAQGAERTVVFDGALVLTNGASLLLPGAANITTAAGDTAIFRGDASGVVRCVSYQPVSGTSVIPPLAAGALNNVQYFTATGTYTPTAGTNSVIVEVVGGGAGSANTGSTTNNAGSGGTTSFGALVSATGGVTAGAGGSGVSGDLNLSARAASFQSSGGSTTGTWYGRGSSAPIYGSPAGGNLEVTTAPSNYGSGGYIVAGSSKSAYGVFGGAGGGYARKRITSAFNGVTITIGAGGTAGTLGSAGTAGLCVVWEYK